MNHFNIELDNPITILQQEEAKVFFKDMKEEELYDFFTRATLLKVNGTLYGEAAQAFNASRENLSKTVADTKRKERERDDWLEKSREIDRIVGNSANKDVKGEIKWLLVQGKEKNQAKCQEEVNKIEEKADNLKEQVESSQKELEEMEVSLEKLSMEARKVQETEQTQVNSSNAAKKAHANARKEHMELRQDVETKEQELARKRADERHLRNEARTKKTQKEQLEQQRAAKKEEMARKKQELEVEDKNIQEDIAKLGQDRDACDSSVSDAKNQVSAQHAEAILRSLFLAQYYNVIFGYCFLRVWRRKASTRGCSPTGASCRGRRRRWPAATGTHGTSPASATRPRP